MYSNAQMESNLIRKYCEIDNQGSLLLKNAMNKLKLSARAYDRILKVSRTIADLDESEQINVVHLAEAIHYRSLDRDHWGDKYSAEKNLRIQVKKYMLNSHLCN